MGLIETKKEIDSKDEILVVPYDSLAPISEGNIQFTLALPSFMNFILFWHIQAHSFICICKSLCRYASICVYDFLKKEHSLDSFVF